MALRFFFEKFLTKSKIHAQKVFNVEKNAVDMLPLIKQKPEDFIVREVTSLSPSKTGRYFYYLLKKRDCTTFDAIAFIAKKFKIHANQIGYAGNKDKVAVTEQFISLPFFVHTFQTRKISMTFAGKGDQRINLGTLQGNEFVITLRRLSKKILKFPKRLPNYFDGQRFGLSKNIEIGKALIKRDFKKAAFLIDGKTGKDPIGQLRKTDKKLLRFYTHAYQSFLWNQVASALVKKTKQNIKIPLFGFLTEFKNPLIKKKYHQILKKEGIRQEDFMIREMPELISEGSERELFFHVGKMKIVSYDKDDLYQGKFKETISFFLPKGSYATLVLKSAIRGLSPGLSKT